MRLDVDAIRATGTSGSLLLYARVKRTGWRPLLLATLSHQLHGEYAIPCLDDARLVKIERGSILLTGAELVTRGTSWKRLAHERYTQTWWCVPAVAAPAPAPSPPRHALEF